MTELTFTALIARVSIMTAAEFRGHCSRFADADGLVSLDLLAVWSARWLETTPVLHAAGVSCEGCDRAEYDEGGIVGCNEPALCPVANGQEQADLLEAFDGDRFYLAEELGRRCPRFYDLLEAEAARRDEYLADMAGMNG